MYALVRGVFAYIGLVAVIHKATGYRLMWVKQTKPAKRLRPAPKARPRKQRKPENRPSTAH